jgi:hypothetical protein
VALLQHAAHLLLFQAGHLTLNLGRECSQQDNGCHDAAA